MTGSDFWKAFSVPLGLIVLFVIALFGVGTITKNMTKPPTVEVTSGAEVVTDQAEVPITGVLKNTDKLQVAGKDVQPAGDGSFSAVVPVTVGVNTVDVVAGDKTKATTSVKVTREEAQTAVASAGVVSGENGAGSDLSSSGPTENVMGSIGLAALVVSLFAYKRSIKFKTQNRA